MFDPLLDFLFPTSIPLWQALGLIALSFFTSFMSASVGIGGGQAMLGVMASVIPVNVLIAVHALVQVGSNAGRAFVQRAHVKWKIVTQYAAGGIIGAVAGGLFFVTLPAHYILLILGCFILWMTWGPKIKIPHIEKWGMPLLGVIGVFLSTVLGSTAAMINSVLRKFDLTRHELIGTQAACVLSQHILKIIVFLSLGIALQEWLGIIALMIATGFIGTWLGTRALNAIPEHMFDIILKIVLTLAGLNLLWEGCRSF